MSARIDPGAPPMRLEPWSERDQPLLEQLLGVPEMTEHIGGPESADKIAERQARYQVPGSRQYRIVLDGEGAGWVGYWEREWLGERVWETGWSVLRRFQGRGVATEATRLLIEIARAERTIRYMHAYPSVDNDPSNAICRKVGFELRGDYEFEYPKATSCAAATGATTCSRRRTGAGRRDAEDAQTQTSPRASHGPRPFNVPCS